MRPDLEAARAALTRIFGHADFRPGQREIVAAVLAGQDVFALMPTGAGKSLLYQLPATIGFAPVIVVSPLISLMRDQIVALRAKGVAAGSLNSVNEPEENDATLAMIGDRRIRLLYVAPERLALGDTVDMLARLRPRLLAVDEAHCVSRWGHDFRPDYARIGEIAAKLGAPQTIAVTATAAPRTRADIEALLFRRKPRLFAQSLQRPNIALSIRRRGHILSDVASAIRAHPGQSGIVYCGSRAATEQLARALVDNAVPALAYHAGLDAATRSAHQDEFLGRDDGVMIATIAFGMGIDKKNVRFVCHADLPHSVEAYYQEIGRAGRDGLPAEAVAFASRAVLAAQHVASDGAMDGRTEDLSAIADLARSFDCRWRSVLAALGEVAAPCGRCDNCRRRLVWLRKPAALPHRLRLAARRGIAAFIERRTARRVEADGEIAATDWPGDAAIEDPPLAVEDARALATLKVARLRIAHDMKLAPAQIADDPALDALVRLDSDSADFARQAAAVLDAFAPCSRALVDVLRATRDSGG